MIRIGLMGAGFVAQFYLQGLAHAPGAKVQAVAGRTLARAEEMARRFGIPRATDDLWGLPHADDVDLVLVALPNFLHVQAVQTAAQAKKPVVCTKPLGRNEAEARAIWEAVREAGVWNGYAETEVFAPAVVHAEQLIRQGSVGEIHLVRSREAHAGPHSPWFYDPDLSGGGALRDMGCHCVEAARYFVGKDVRPVAVLAWGATREHSTRAEDNAVALIRFASGALAQVEVSWTAHGGLDLRNEVHGSRGSIFTDVTRGTPIRAFVLGEAGYVVEKGESERGWVQPVVDEAEVYGYASEMRHFVQCVAEGTSSRETFADGVWVNAILDRAYRSMREMRWVSLEDIAPVT